MGRFKYLCDDIASTGDCRSTLVSPLQVFNFSNNSIYLSNDDTTRAALYTYTLGFGKAAMQVYFSNVSYISNITLAHSSAIIMYWENMNPTDENELVKYKIS